MFFKRRKSEVEFLRGEVEALRLANRDLTQQIIALTNPNALAVVQAANIPITDPQDEAPDRDGEIIIAYNDLGQRILCRKGKPKDQ